MFLSTSRLCAVAGVVVALVVTSPAPHARARALGRRPPVDVGCRSCLVVDDRGRALWSRRPSRRLPNASTTKMLTALVVVRRSDVDDTVRVSRGAAATGGGGLDLAAGDRYSVHGLLYALLLSSSNDAAVALAEDSSGTETRFVEAMNRLAVRLGADRTRFVTAHGLDAPGHHTTARDLATIADALLAQPLLADIVDTESIAIRGPDGPVLLENRNVLLEAYKGAVGVKTGFTDRAGQVLVAAAQRHGRRIIAVALRSQDAAADCRKLLDYGWLRLRRTVLVAAGALVGRVVFDPAGSVAAVAARSMRGPEHPEDLDLSLEVAATARPAIERGQRLATATLAVRGPGSAGPHSKPGPGSAGPHSKPGPGSAGPHSKPGPGSAGRAVPAIAAGALEAAPPNPVIEALGGILRWGDRAARLVGAR